MDGTPLDWADVLAICIITKVRIDHPPNFAWDGAINKKRGGYRLRGSKTVKVNATFNGALMPANRGEYTGLAPYTAAAALTTVDLEFGKTQMNLNESRCLTLPHALKETLRVFNEFAKAFPAAKLPDTVQAKINEYWRNAFNDNNVKTIIEAALIKSVGDIGQELNGVLNNSGYFSPIGTGWAAAPQTQKVKPVAWSKAAAKTKASPTPLPHNLNGHTDRLIVSNDQPSAARIAILLKSVPPTLINMNAIGGFASSAKYILWDASGNKNEPLSKAKAVDIYEGGSQTKKKHTRKKRKKKRKKKRTRRRAR